MRVLLVQHETSQVSVAHKVGSTTGIWEAHRGFAFRSAVLPPRVR